MAIIKSRKRGCEQSDCVRWLKRAISFDAMKTQTNANPIIRKRREKKDR